MKAIRLAGACVLALLTLLPLHSQNLSDLTAMTVQVALSQIRESPSVAAPVLVSVTYRQKLFVFGSMDGWTKVRIPGSSRYGYIFASALTVKSIPSTVPGAAVKGVSETEIALAGKGFDQVMEEEYRQKAHIDFSWVDAMERLAYAPESCALYLAGGSAR